MGPAGVAVHEAASLLEDDVSGSHRMQMPQYRLRILYRAGLATASAVVLVSGLALRSALLPGTRGGKQPLVSPSKPYTMQARDDIASAWAFKWPFFSDGSDADNEPDNEPDKGPDKEPDNEPEPETKSASGYMLITSGTCQKHGMYPILHVATCEAAAKELGLGDTALSLAHHVRRPEGCYYAHNKKLHPQLWIGISPSSKGNGVETSTPSVSRRPICAPTAEMGSGRLDRKFDAGVGFQVKQTFYVYHAETDTDDSTENINGGDLPGLLWYLHNKVVTECPRKFGITKVRRIKISMKNTDDLYNDTQTQFGPYLAFWNQKCFTHGCRDYYERYGATVGCQTLPTRRGVWGAYCRPPGCRPGHLYSLPGACPLGAKGNKSEACRKEFPSGACAGNDVNGARNCTYHVEDAGVVSIDNVTGIHDYDAFCESGGLEFSQKTDHGRSLSFWDGINDKAKCAWRLGEFLKHFKRKYPERPVTIGSQGCDWRWSNPL